MSKSSANMTANYTCTGAPATSFPGPFPWLPHPQAREKALGTRLGPLTCNIIVYTTPDSLNFSAMDRGLRPKKVVNKIKACQRCQTCKCLRCSSRLVSAIKGPYDERRVSALHWARKAASNRAYLRAGSSYTTEERETRRWVQRAGADVIDSLMSQIIRHNK